MSELSITPEHARRQKITAIERARRNGHRGCVVWLTGLSGAGKSTLAAHLEWELVNMGRQVFVLDGDLMRRGLCSGLTFSPVDRKENIRRVSEVAKLFAESGVICIVALISPYRDDRRLARQLVTGYPFIEIYVNAPLEVCEKRDPKGLYARARNGEIPEFTGISSPYESPEKPELELRTDKLSITESTDRAFACLSKVCDLSDVSQMYTLSATRRVVFEFLPLSWLQTYRQMKKWFSSRQAPRPLPFRKVFAAHKLTIFLSGLILAGVGCLDYFTGPYVTILPLYAISPAVLALIVNGRWGTFAAILSSLVWLALQMAGDVRLSSGVLLWNFLIRFFVFQLVVLLLDRVRIAIATPGNRDL
jgi:adenylylsulfate kinase